MPCCGGDCYSAMFDDKRARKDLDRFRKDGPDPTTRALIDALRARSIDGASLLDIGGGIGAIHHELIDAGAAGAIHADASGPYIGVAREEADRRGHADRVEFLLGDFVAGAETVGPADVVTLDRVICCYEDMESLVAASASRARRLYGVVIPRDRWHVKVVFVLINLWKRITRNSFRVYLHPVASIEAAIRRQGLTPRTQLNTFVWRVAVYER